MTEPRTLGFIGLTGLLFALGTARATPPTPPSALPKPPTEGFDRCLGHLRAQAIARGIGPEVWDEHMQEREPDPGVLEARDAQPEFQLPPWDYLAALVDAERIADGQGLLAQHAETFAAVTAHYGVDAPTVAAVWGIESDYGRITGKRELLTSLATLACSERRQAFFRDELFALLQIVQRGDVDPSRLTGSWAGAFGQTQFMPSTYRRLAQDFDGDGRRDLIDSIPDALASTAHYLRRAGWRPGQTWGVEVLVPPGFDARQAGRTARHPIAFWRAQGLRRVDGSTLDNLPDTAALLLPAGVEGPAWLVFRNFDVIYSYNASERYALAISLLSDGLAQGPGQQRPWPTDDPGTSRAERRELQRILLERGHAIGDADGLVGSKTRDAIKAEEARLGWPVSGRAGQRLLRALREPSPPAP
jgi:lytic murein transglycosylase